MLKSVRIASLLALAAAFGCRCEDGAGAIAPQIYLDACKTPQKKVQGTLIGGYEECGVGFGTRDISVKLTQNIKVTNPSIVELVLENIEIVGDPSFKVELKPDTIGPGLSGDIIISVRPKTVTTLDATLYVLSDANNTQQTEEGKSLIEIPLTVTGVDNGVPDITVDPLNCDFGRVPQGGVQTCSVSITNDGSRGLVLDLVDFVPVGDDPAVLFQVPPDSTAVPFAFTGRPPGPDEEIAPGATVTLPVRFTPDVLGNFQGKFRILSNDPDEEQIDIPLSGISVTPPTCVIKIKSINGQDVTSAVPTIEPLDNVVLTLADSTPSTPDGSITRYEWSIGARPAGSTVTLTNELGEETGFTFDDDLGVDLAGEYTVRAQVFDDLDTPSVNECELSFEAIPKDNFLAQLSWDTDDNDLDLHATRQGTASEYCISSTSGEAPSGLLSEDCDNSLDCNFSSCRQADTDSPEWDGVSGRTAGDPSLDIDDINGFGPENINVDLMSPGLYLVGVNEYSGTSESPAGATLRLFVFGRLAGEFFAQLDVGDWWEAALVEWPAIGTRVCIEDLTDGDGTDDIERCHAGAP